MLHENSDLLMKSLKEDDWLCWGLTSQSTIFQSCRDGAIASWVFNQYFRGVKCLAQGHNTAAVGLEPRTSRSGVRHSTTEPPRSPKKDEKNALLKEQNERQVLFCTVTSLFLHDDAKIHTTSVRLYNVLETWREMKTVFQRNILIRTGKLILFYISIRYD